MVRFDIKLTDNQEIELTNLKPTLVNENDYIKQKIKIVLLFFFKEWFLNNKDGTQYKEKILKKDFNLSEIERHLRNRIRSIEEIVNIIFFEIDISNLSTKREISVKFIVTTVNSEQIKVLEGFILNV